MKIVLSFLLLVIAFAFSTNDFSSVKAKDYESVDADRLEDLKFNDSNPVELGHVDWIRNFDKAEVLAIRENKPLLVFFQEVPGCSTSSGYGKRVLTNPLIVEAIETLFIPVAIYNNSGGHDREILKSFNEPSWNNPVVRIITADRKDLTPRLNGDYSKLGLVRSMRGALISDNRKVPEYLNIMEKELSAEKIAKEKAIFAMHCFWTGEGKLGNIDGVLSTKPGFMGGREVVEVNYNPSEITYKELLNKAKKKSVASHVFTINSKQKQIAEELVGSRSVSDAGSFRPDGEPKYYMSKTNYRYLPMTKLQSSLVNSALGDRQSPKKYLSLRQLQLLEFIKRNPNLVWKSQIKSEDFISSWNDTVELLNTKISLN